MLPSLISKETILQFLNLFGDVQSIKKAEDRHAKLFLPHRSSPELKKRHAEDFLASDKTKLAKSYSGVPSPAQSLMGTYANPQSQWPAGYGAQPQAWPPASQPQGQQWTPGYAQQVKLLATVILPIPLFMHRVSDFFFFLVVIVDTLDY